MIRFVVPCLFVVLSVVPAWHNVSNNNSPPPLQADSTIIVSDERLGRRNDWGTFGDERVGRGNRLGRRCRVGQVRLNAPWLRVRVRVYEGVGGSKV